MDTPILTGGFSDPPVQSARAFRAILNALARPGEIVTLAGTEPPAPLSVAAAAVVLTLCDPETPVCLAGAADTSAVREWITFQTGAPFCSPQDARFALGSWEALRHLPLPLGTPEYPDRSATLIVEVEALGTTGATLRGPGIRDTATLSLPDLAPFQANARLFPLGLDYLFTCGDRLAGLPRSTAVS